MGGCRSPLTASRCAKPGMSKHNLQERASMRELSIVSVDLAKNGRGLQFGGGWVRPVPEKADPASIRMVRHQSRLLRMSVRKLCRIHNFNGLGLGDGWMLGPSLRHIPLIPASEVGPDCTPARTIPKDIVAAVDAATTVQDLARRGHGTRLLSARSPRPDLPSWSDGLVPLWLQGHGKTLDMQEKQSDPLQD